MFEGYFHDRPTNKKAVILFILVVIVFLVLAIINP